MWALLGTALAALLPAAGPAFYHQVVGQNDFLPLVDYLRSVHEAAGLPPVSVQDQLWAERLKGRALHGGISAMPSMHVGMATLFALVGWQIHRWAGVIATFFAAGIMIGSVHLGWHYALDGYVAAPLTLLIWVGVGRGLALANCRSAP
jgi:membrane-associated phospholipid phosphatase